MNALNWTDGEKVQSPVFILQHFIVIQELLANIGQSPYFQTIEL